jgi:hypothetical protein
MIAAHGDSPAVQLAVEVLSDPKVRELIKGLIDEIDGRDATKIKMEGSFKLTDTDDEGMPWQWRCTSCDRVYDRPDPHYAPGDPSQPCPMVSWRQETQS